MHFDFRMFRFLPGSHAARSLVSAGLLVGCLPFDPFGTCELDPPCSQRAYFVKAWHPERVPGTVNIDWTGTARFHGLPIAFSLRSITPAAAARRGASGLAYALSCSADCPDTFTADSVFFTTDFIGPAGDTLKARTPLDSANLPSGLRFRGGSWVRVDSGAFRNPEFELHIRGRIDGVHKAALLRLWFGDTTGLTGG